MTFSAECECDKFKNPINANAEVFCFWCVEDLRIELDNAKQTISELREIIKVLEKKDAVVSRGR